MEFFIKKNATLPVLKINVIKDGRSDYNRSMKFLSETDVFFSMVDTETNIPRITTRPAGLMSKIGVSGVSTSDYYVYYQFTPFDTKKVGRYKGQFLFRDETGVLVLPLNDEIYINVTDSFVLNDAEFQSCYVVDYPCCSSFTPPIPPVPPGPSTTSTTLSPSTTTSTTSPITTTTSTIIPCVVCTSGVTLPQIGQTVTYNNIRLSAGYTLPSDISYSTGDTVMTCFEELQGPQTGSLLVGSNAPSPTQGSPFNYELVILDGPVNNLVFRLVNYNKTTGFTPSFTFVGQRRDGLLMDPIITACEYCCATIDGNTITAGDNTDCEMGSGYFRISTEFPYDRLQISGTGGNNGCYIDICQDTIVPPPVRSTAWTITRGVTDGRFFCDGDVTPFVTLYTEESATLQQGMQLFNDEYLTSPVTYLLNTSFFTVLARNGVELTERYAFTIYGSVEQNTTPEFVNYVLYCNQPIPCRELTITRNAGFPLVRWFDCNAQLAGQQIGIGQTITICGSFPIGGTGHVTTIGPNC
jgi:hypothetical protein